ncbi:hypothetical protein N200_05635 [Helicobacter pylori UM065]|nr:hypothetical protein N200_05635 [Helicobacter pylori UM065]
MDFKRGLTPFGFYAQSKQNALREWKCIRKLFSNAIKTF